MRQESGLLAEPALLRDMEISLQELTVVKTELEYLKEDNKLRAQQIRHIRKNIEYSADTIVKTRSGRITIVKKRSTPKVRKGKPNLSTPKHKMHSAI